ncbi:hypothetical protein [Burkholderia ambifaria]|uniref:Uncharacterized protein n=1 Tax=Burkholderia ambifaria MEX-5 TaxID=396597 RepID=B1TC01_9BURK|nr:hypothetical protein [Burkholderia ambifaria]EDT38907.1 hypothetical protein BamMEX5DRAFT_5317 [Burkholderia ambifaria MEX-5]
MPLERRHALDAAGPRADPRVPRMEQGNADQSRVLGHGEGARIGGDVHERERIAGEIWAVDQESLGVNERVERAPGQPSGARFVALLCQCWKTIADRSRWAKNRCTISAVGMVTAAPTC